MNGLPTVALLVAVRNEAEHLGRCIRSLLAQSYPAERLEILILDGKSTDGSRELADRMLLGRSGARVVDNPGVTQARAWNLGLTLAASELVGIVSGHAELAADYVAQAVAALQRTGADMVGGPARAVSEGLVGETIAVAQTSRFGVGGARFRYSTIEEDVDTVFMGVCHRRLYERIGGFDPEMDRNQDDELSFRLRERGGRIVCSPAIRSSYFNRSTLASLWRQYVAYGFWKVRVMQKHRAQMRLSHFVPAAFVGALAGALLLFPLWGWWPTSLLLIAYGIASMVGTLAAATRGHWKAAPLLPLVFAILHVGYGVGFWRGLVHWHGKPLALTPDLPPQSSNMR